MREIHNRLENDILNEDGDGQRSMFKIFSNVVTTKKDIERLGKERRFMRSQLSQHCPYEEPKIATQLKISRRERVLTAVYEEKELRLKAQEFTLKVKQEKEVLLGMQFIRRKM